MSEDDDDFEYNDDNDSCPECGGPGMLLGTLGRLLWFRCRDCGIEFNTKEQES